MSRTLKVELGARSYNIEISNGCLSSAGEHIQPFAGSGRVFLIFDEALENNHLPILESSLKSAGLNAISFKVASGEASKSMQTYERLLDELILQRPERKDLVIAFGGGVVGDLAGFVAASLLRGLDFVQIPTTLLSQVDSSVGGKTGINSPHGKNLIGAFHQPKLVLIDTNILETLPHRELKAGYGEVVKYGCINNLPFFEWLETNGQAVLNNDVDALAEAIFQSCKTKADIVIADETETSGIRSLLNLGHTFGHALEAEAHYDGTLLHGEGVLIGISMAFKLSHQLGLCSGQDLTRVENHFKALDLPIDCSKLKTKDLTVEKLVEHMSRDKKVVDGKPRFVLVRGIGQAYQSDGADPLEVKKLLKTYLET